MMKLQDKYLDRIADALEANTGIGPKLISGGVQKPNIYRIADALDPEPVLLKDGTIKNPLARIAEAIESGSFGGKNGKLLYGIEPPTSDIGENKDIYVVIGSITPSYGGDQVSGLGWGSSEGAICKNTDTIGTIKGRSYYKTTSDPAIVAFFPMDGYIQLRCVSTVREGVNSTTSAGGGSGTVYSHEIQGLTWYFSMGDYGYVAANSTVESEYPVLKETYDFSKVNDATNFLDHMGLVIGEYDPSKYLVLKAFIKVKNVWRNLLYTSYDDIL